KVDGVVNNVKDKVEDALGDLKNNETVKKVVDKVDEVIDDLKESETFKAAKDKIEGLVEDLQSSEAAKNVSSFMDEHEGKANEVIDSVTEQVKKSGFFNKLKGLFGGK
ncbi:MAG: hypothetical protein PHC48_04210, partial [Prevotella sp.]|nr:hypothetical protein [Prevotella sp.]